MWRVRFQFSGEAATTWKTGYATQQDADTDAAWLLVNGYRFDLDGNEVHPASTWSEVDPDA